MQWRSIKVVKTTTGKKKEAPQQQPAKVLPTAASLLQGNKKKASNATASAKKKKASKCAPPSQQQKQPQQKSRQQFQHFAEQPSTSKTPETQQKEKEPPKKQTKKQQLPAVALALLPPKTDKKKHKLGAKCNGESKVIRLRADGGAFRNRYARAIARRRRRAQKAAKRRGPRSELLQRVYQLKKEPLLEEMRLNAEKKHPDYLKAVERIDAAYKRELELIDIMEKDGLERIEESYQTQKEALKREHEQKLEEMVAQLSNEIEEKKRYLESEINSLDVSTSARTQSSYFYAVPNKKTLRKRPNEQGDSGEKAKGFSRKHSTQSIVHLLPDSTMNADVRLMCSGLMRSGAGANANSGPSNSLRPVWHGEGEETWRQRKVTFEANRLLYEGKSFHRGQNVTIQTLNYGKFTAILQAITEKYCQFRSSIAGDTRQVMATKDDLETGRVLVRKRY